MFDKNKFSEILNKIYKSYDNQRLFAEATNVNRGYLSRYINKKIDSPPTPKILAGIANASKGITSYEELMQICGYTENFSDKQNIVNYDIAVLPLFVSDNGKLEIYNDLWVSKSILDIKKQYFAYKTNDDSMLPLLGKGDIAIIEKTDTFQNGDTCLINLDSINILIRKIVDFTNYIELHTAFPYGQPIQLTKEDMNKRNFKILGKIIRVENSSAFK